MPIFDFTDPNGKQYTVTGPDGATPQQAFAILQGHLGNNAGSPQTPTGLTPVTDPALLAQLNSNSSTAAPTGLKLVTDPDILKQLNAEPSTTDKAIDAVKGAAKGLATGAEGLAGLPGDAEKGVDWALRKVLPSNDTVRGWFGAKPLNQKPQLPTPAMPTTDDIDSVANASALPDPQSTPGKYAETIGSFVPGAVAGPDGIAKNLLMRAVIPGAASEAAGQVTEGTPLEVPARVAAAVLLGGKGGKAPELPSADDLRAAADAGYDQARAMPVSIKPSSASQWAGTTQVNLAKQGFNDKLAPNTHAVLDELQDVPAGAGVTMDNLDTARKTLGNIAGNYNNPTEQAAASKAINGLDDFVTNLSPADVLSGDAQAAANTWSDARGNYAAAKRAETVADTLDTAELNAAAANSGNIGNATRAQFKKLLTSDSAGRGFNGDELNQVNSIVRGTATGNLLRKVSNVLGAGGGRLGQSLAMAAGGYVGSQADGPEGAAAGAVLPLLAGAAARRFANGVTARQVNQLDNMVRSRSPLAANGRMTRGQQVRASLAQLGNTARALIAMRSGQQQ